MKAWNPIRLGVLTDTASGFSTSSGRGSVIAAEMAVEDFKTVPGVPPPLRVELISADHQNAAGVARGWLDRGIDAVLDVTNAAAALAVNLALRNSKAAFLVSGDRIMFERAWHIPLGFEPAPSEVPP